MSDLLISKVLLSFPNKIANKDRRNLSTIYMLQAIVKTCFVHHPTDPKTIQILIAPFRVFRSLTRFICISAEWFWHLNQSSQRFFRTAFFSVLFCSSFSFLFFFIYFLFSSFLYYFDYPDKLDSLLQREREQWEKKIFICMAILGISYINIYRLTLCVCLKIYS